MPSTKFEGLCYPTHFLGSVIRNHFLEYRSKQVNIFLDKMFFHTLFATNKAKNIPNRHILVLL